MQLIRRSVVALAASICIGSPLWADLAPNPYSAVIERNSFGLREPPLPQPVTPPQPAVPLPKVVLTGIITSLFGPTPKVLLEVTEQEPGKAANVKKPILRQGEKDGMIEVLLIDVANNQVKIRNGTVETNITFEVAKASGGPAGGLPSIPGLVPPGLPTSPVAPGRRKLPQPRR